MKETNLQIDRMTSIFDDAGMKSSSRWLLSPEVAGPSMSGSTLIVVASALLVKRVNMSEFVGRDT
jgi:cation transport ATPase